MFFFPWCYRYIFGRETPCLKYDNSYQERWGRTRWCREQTIVRRHPRSCQIKCEIIRSIRTNKTNPHIRRCRTRRGNSTGNFPFHRKRCRYFLSRRLKLQREQISCRFVILWRWRLRMSYGVIWGSVEGYAVPHDWNDWSLPPLTPREMLGAAKWALEATSASVPEDRRLRAETWDWTSCSG